MPTPRQVLKAIDDFALAAWWCIASGKMEAPFAWQEAEYDGRYPDTVLVTWLEFGPSPGAGECVAWPVHLDELEIDCDPVYIALCRWQREQARGLV